MSDKNTPIVGDKATFTDWDDSIACTVTTVAHNGRTVWITEDGPHERVFCVTRRTTFDAVVDKNGNAGVVERVCWKPCGHPTNQRGADVRFEG